eukprot:scaffold13997_cov72-Phaeocystis_antarctica.AAC.2
MTRTRATTSALTSPKLLELHAERARNRRSGSTSTDVIPAALFPVLQRKFEIAYLRCFPTGTTPREATARMRVSVFTLVVLLVPYLPAAALIGGIAPRTRLFSTRPRALTAELARPAAFRAPQPTLSAAKAAEPAKTSEPTKPSEPAKPRKATLSEWGTLLRLCSQARHAKLHRHHTPRLTTSYTPAPHVFTGQAARRLRLRDARARLGGRRHAAAAAGARAQPCTLTTHHSPLTTHHSTFTLTLTLTLTLTRRARSTSCSSARRRAVHRCSRSSTSRAWESPPPSSPGCAALPSGCAAPTSCGGCAPSSSAHSCACRSPSTTSAPRASSPRACSQTASSWETCSRSTSTSCSASCCRHGGSSNNPDPDH